MKSTFLRVIVALGLTASGAAAMVAAQEDSERLERKSSGPWKEWTFIDQRSGDCHMSGILTIFADGYAIWTASTKTDSTHNKDIWHETLEVQNSKGQRLFGFGVWDSPPMDSPPNGGEYNWRKGERFPAGFFDDAETATSSGDC